MDMGKRTPKPQVAGSIPVPPAPRQAGVHAPLAPAPDFLDALMTRLMTVTLLNREGAALSSVRLAANRQHMDSPVASDEDGAAPRQRTHQSCIDLESSASLRRAARVASSAAAADGSAPRESSDTRTAS